MLILRKLNILLILLLFISISPAYALLGFGEKQELDEKERQETIERIEDVQSKLKLLQEKLKALERRKAAEQAAQRASGEGDLSPASSQVNWLPTDETVRYPGDFGIYTYLLYIGEAEDKESVGALEDLILTIETLPPNDIPEGLSNRFLVPVEKPHSIVDLGQQPYDYKLNQAFLNRLQLRDSLPRGPILVSLNAPIDPFAEGNVSEFLAASLGRQKPEKALELVKVWHGLEINKLVGTGRPISDLFWAILDQAGTGIVTKFNQRLLIELPTRQ